MSLLTSRQSPPTAPTGSFSFSIAVEDIFLIVPVPLPSRSSSVSKDARGDATMSYLRIKKVKVLCHCSPAGSLASTQSHKNLPIISSIDSIYQPQAQLMPSPLLVPRRHRRRLNARRLCVWSVTVQSDERVCRQFASRRVHATWLHPGASRPARPLRR